MNALQAPTADFFNRIDPKATFVPAADMSGVIDPALVILN
jgi:hypothetical protein